MHAVTVIALLMALAAVEVHPQCFTTNDFRSAALDPDLSGVSHLAAELYRQLDTKGNFFFSPYSIWTALSLTYLGTSGRTETQLREALKVNDKINTLNLINSLKMVASRRKAVGTNFTFNDANRIYVDDNLVLPQCVIGRLHDLLEVTDIYGNPAGAAQLINSFVSDTTENRIQQLVSAADLIDGQMVLVNAAFFKGKWIKQFEARATRPTDFKVTPNSAPQSVPMMHQTATLRIGKSEELGAQVLELPYSGDSISMFVMLPEEEGEAGWEKMKNALSGPALQRVADRSHLTSQLVNVMLPRFKAEKMLKKELIEGLQQMGVTDLFDYRRANLSLFNNELVVSKVIHKAFVEVNEEGTEAAAATAVIAVTRSGHSHRPRPIPFHCNRPFLYIIVDLETRSLLFMGSYRNPIS